MLDGLNSSFLFLNASNVFTFSITETDESSGIDEMEQQRDRQNNPCDSETYACGIWYNRKYSVVLYHEEKFIETFVNLFLHVYS